VVVLVKRKASYQELTSRENDEINADLTRRSWGLFSVVDLRAQRAEILELLPATYSEPYDPENPPVVDAALLAKIENHLRALITIARRTSGSIDGKHRADITEAVKNQAPVIAGVATGPQSADQAQQPQQGGGTV
jgi:hypothetical protein